MFLFILWHELIYSKYVEIQNESLDAKNTIVDKIASRIEEMSVLELR